MSDLLEKEKRAIKLLRTVAKTTDGEIELSYSGGKDSDVCLALAQMAGIPYRAIYKNTTIDPPGTIAHCKEVGAEIIRPKKSFFEIIEQKGFPSRFARFCCSELKEYKILDTAIQGIRRSESTKRAANYKEPIICRTYGSKANHVNVVLPILDWSDADVRRFIVSNDVKCHPLYYDENGQFCVNRRLGCLGCPMASDNGLHDFKQYPNLVKAWIRAGNIWLTKPFAHECNTRKYCNDAYEYFVMHTFLDGLNDFKMIQSGMFGKVDCKQFLQNYFKIEL